METATRDKTRHVSKDDVILRPLRQQEIPALAAVIDELDAAHLNNRWREQQMRYRELMVAELDGELVGTVSIGVTSWLPHSLHLFALEVATEQRDRGIGTAIILHVIDEARRRGLSRVHLEVRIDNPARRLYHRMGFRRHGESYVNAWVQFYDDGSTARMEEESYRMAKLLK